ncbi:MAG: matrixin family metalloprotease, partial [Acidobacteriaceae bacterium]|nr:matrixin family metalloprotease [Acidobacteriaceae bacterium]
PTGAVTYRLNPASATANANIKDQGTRSAAAVMQASFATWTSAPGVLLSAVRGPDDNTTVSPTTSENLIAFSCTGSNCDFNTDGTLAVTITNTDNRGNITSANIFFNQKQSFTTVSANASQEQDMQTVATHEVGHFFGMDHSGIVGAIMFPIAPTLETTLSDDDVAGISSLYPASSDGGSPQCPSGTARISGTVKLNGSAVFGAHVFAEPVNGTAGFGGSIRQSAVGTLTLPDGTYQIACLPVGSYVVTAEPLDGPETNSDVGWAGSGGVFSSPSSVQTNFTTRWH